jgi:hypothetical protein
MVRRWRLIGLFPDPRIAQVTYNAKEPLLDLQWAAWEEVRWERVLEGSLVANHYYCRRGLVRRVELYMALISRAQVRPNTHSSNHYYCLVRRVELYMIKIGRAQTGRENR